MRIITEKIDIPRLGRKGVMRVLLPDGHGGDGNDYPVLYMQDGHNLFDPQASSYGRTWRVREALEAEAAAGRPCRLIVVGVDSPHGGTWRMDEYSPWVNREIGEMRDLTGIESAGGRGQAYAEFIALDLAPAIESRFGASTSREGRFVAGSSMGGLIALYMGFSMPERFSALGAFSTATWFAKRELFAFLRARVEELGNRAPAVYADVGARETINPAKAGFPARYLEEARELFVILGPRARNRYLVDEEGDHSEDAWARRFPGFLAWLRGVAGI
jgi:predicted alpha/beta superfamily hydrolase